jgi:hypothetical protein
VGFEPAIPSSERQQSDVLYSAVSVGIKKAEKILRKAM